METINHEERVNELLKKLRWRLRDFLEQVRGELAPETGPLLPSDDPWSLTAPKYRVDVTGEADADGEGLTLHGELLLCFPGPRPSLGHHPLVPNLAHRLAECIPHVAPPAELGTGMTAKEQAGADDGDEQNAVLGRVVVRVRREATNW